MYISTYDLVIFTHDHGYPWGVSPKDGEDLLQKDEFCLTYLGLARYRCIYIYDIRISSYIYIYIYMCV